MWEYVGKFAEFNRYTNSPVANYKGEIYNMPFNMNTFHKLWGVVTPQEAREKIESQKQQYAVEHPKNLEEQAISLVGPDVYHKLVKGYHTGGPVCLPLLPYKYFRQYDCVCL